MCFYRMYWTPCMEMSNQWNYTRSYKSWNVWKWRLSNHHFLNLKNYFECHKVSILFKFRNTSMGVMYIILGTVFSVLYLPVLIVMHSSQFQKHSCYKILTALSYVCKILFRNIRKESKKISNNFFNLVWYDGTIAFWLFIRSVFNNWYPILWWKIQTSTLYQWSSNWGLISKIDLFYIVVIQLENGSDFGIR